MRRWRPTWGYFTAGAWALQSIAILALSGGAIAATLKGESVAANALLGAAAELLSALTVQWSVALAVLGVNVSKRSQDKAAQAGQAPAPGILGAIVNRIAGGA